MPKQRIAINSMYGYRVRRFFLKGMFLEIVLLDLVKKKKYITFVTVFLINMNKCNR